MAFIYIVVLFNLESNYHFIVIIKKTLKADIQPLIKKMLYKIELKAFSKLIV